MNDRNRFQQLIDRDLAGLQWNERCQEKVLRAIDTERRLPAMSKLLKPALALCLILCLITGAAVATYTIRYDPKADAQKLAVQAMKEQYGLTDAALGLFQNPVREENGAYRVIYSNNLLVPDELTGIYTISINGRQATVTWTYDETSPDVYASGSLECQIWGPPQFNYLATLTPSELVQQTKPYQTEKRHYDHTEYRIEVLTPAPGEVTEQEAIGLALDALQDTYALDPASLPAEHISTLMTNFSLPQPSWYVWVDAPSGAANYTVIINARTGEVYRINVDTPTPP